jgi:hypothetical protein
MDDILDRAKGMAYEYQLSHAVAPNVPELVLAGLEVYSLLKKLLIEESSKKSNNTNHCPCTS